MKNIQAILFLILCLLLIMITTSDSIAQRPEDGSYLNRKYGVMDANLCRIPFHTYGRLGTAMGYEIEYPKGSGHLQLDAVGPLVVTRIVDADGKKQACVETSITAAGWTDISADGTTNYAYEPIAGFSNPYQNEAAMSDDKYTWPVYWPDKMDLADDPGWPGTWNGYFGKGVTNADLETYFVIDDDPDEEFDYYPDANDSSRRGLGTQVYIRAMQWSNVLTESHCFWLYDILNEGTVDYDSMYFALFCDFKIGGNDDDVAGYEAYLDAAYCYDFLNIGSPGNYSPVPAVCYGYLESPTNWYDFEDNDDDGLLNESRDSGPGQLVFGSCGYYDDNGAFDYDRQENDPTNYYERKHYSGDEDGDWQGFTDENGNNTWDPGEQLNDDLGADGIGPYDDEYDGPDTGEGDGIPTSGEPDFDKTDLDEGDQIGLTMFWSGEYGDRKNHSNDELVLEWCHEKIDVKIGTPAYHAGNLGAWFHSGPVKHPSEIIQRFSFSLFFATGPTPSAQIKDAFDKKKTVQQIYNANYRFAQPPKAPTLKAVAGDGKVYLYWDDIAESSWDRFFGEYDFEGYSLYRSTDPVFQDARIITDGYGTLSLYKPLFRCDKKDSISGFFPGTYNGVQFYIGENTGLVHSYVDDEVVNGQTYYYALCSFDYGHIPDDSSLSIQDIQKQAVLPSESTMIITIDQLNKVKNIPRNCAAVVPTAAAAGYTTPDIEASMVHSGPQSTTSIIHNIFNPFELTESTYRLEFDYPDSAWRGMPEYQILKLNINAMPDTIMPWKTFDLLSERTDYFDGLIIDMEFDTSLTPLVQGWKKGSKCNMEVLFSPTEKSNAQGDVIGYNGVNWDFDFVFTEDISDTSMKVGLYTPEIAVPFYIYSPTIGKRLNFTVVDNRGDGKWGVDDRINIVLGPKRGIEPQRGRVNKDYMFTWVFKFAGFDGQGWLQADSTGWIHPQPGDVFQVRMNIPPQDGEAYEFTTSEPVIDNKKARADLDNIAVVPNPYVVTERWEPSSPYLAGRGPMEIHFTHLPNECTIRIFTVQGYLVDTIKHTADINDGTAAWDMMSKDNMHIAPGNYIYHVQSPYGEKIGRFMIIK